MDDVLKYAVENGMIDVSYIQKILEMNKRKELLAKHGKEIWQGKNMKWYTYLPDEEKGRVLKKRNTKEEIEDVIVSYWTEQMENPTIKEVFEEWNDRRLELKKISPSTHLRNRQVYNRHYSDFGKKRIKNVTQDEIEDFLERQVPEYDLTAKAFSNLKTITRGFLKRAKKRKLISFNVEEIFSDLDTSETDFKKVIKEDCQEVFNEQEMPQMLDFLEKNMDIKNLGIMLMFVTGLRIGELVTLKKSDISEKGISISRTETRYVDENGHYVFRIKDFPKTQAGVRTVVVPSNYMWILDEINKRNPDGEYLFEKNGKRIITYAIRRRLASNCKKTGIYPKSPHKIRKTYGSILFDNHIDQRLIMEQMGHADILVGEIHYHRNRRDTDRKSEIISAIPDFKKQGF